MQIFTIYFRTGEGSHPPAKTVQARYITYEQHCVVLHNGTRADRPVAVVPYENFRLLESTPAETFE